MVTMCVTHGMHAQLFLCLLTNFHKTGQPPPLFVTMNYTVCGFCLYYIAWVYLLVVDKQKSSFSPLSAAAFLSFIRNVFLCVGILILLYEFTETKQLGVEEA